MLIKASPLPPPNNAAIRNRRLVAFSLAVIAALIYVSISSDSPRRVLVANTPVTRLVKSQFSELQTLANNLQVDKHAPFNILALGGSITWAEGLLTRSNAYPYVLGRLLHPKATVDNLAIRAEGTSVPARCIESLTTRPTEGFISSDPLKEMKPKPYHLVLMEFTMTGALELAGLVNRLQERFPDAVFVYVHLHSKNAGQQDHDRLLQKQVKPYLKKRTRVYSMPFTPDTQQWYTKDGIHLNVLGHLKITYEILKILQDEVLPFDPRMGNWKTHDYCESWFLSGKLPESVAWNGGLMNEFNPAGGKYAYEIREKASLVITNPFPRPVSLGLSFMVRGRGGMYPRVLVDIEGRGPKPHMLVPEQASLAHLQKTDEVGNLKPGKNVVQFEVVQKTPWPFRVTGFSLVYNEKKKFEDISIVLGDGILDNAETEVGQMLSLMVDMPQEEGGGGDATETLPPPPPPPPPSRANTEQSKRGRKKKDKRASAEDADADDRPGPVARQERQAYSSNNGQGSDNSASRDNGAPSEEGELRNNGRGLEQTKSSQQDEEGPRIDPRRMSQENNEGSSSRGQQDEQQSRAATSAKSDESNANDRLTDASVEEDEEEEGGEDDKKVNKLEDRVLKALKEDSRRNAHRSSTLQEEGDDGQERSSKTKSSSSNSKKKSSTERNNDGDRTLDSNAKRGSRTLTDETHRDLETEQQNTIKESKNGGSSKKRVKSKTA